MLCISTDTKSVFVCFTGVQAWRKWEKWLRFVCLRLCAQSQLVCSGCRNLLLYPVGATSVCCAVCNAVTAVPPPGKCLNMYLVTLSVQLYMSRHRNGPAGLRRLPHLAHVHPWSNERAVFLLPYSQSSPGGLGLGDKHQIYNMTANQVAHVNCGSCRMLLMYQYGARSVKCAVCNFVTPVGVSSSIHSSFISC
ncbi:hypothetical protein DKX38_001091 [Salix brachista]|uniref:Zinc finger LSD1-type domain-containing protein n=1 Tax=Salix brachista TaxID=2182728 RepID=A0A5N5P3S3_9ROSI|nr:hypothetical protein DKX38_001091 [Salix brachista]